MGVGAHVVVVALVIVAFVVVIVGLGLTGLGLVVVALFLGRVVGAGVDLNQLGGGGDVDDGLGGVLLDGLVDRALEAGQVDNCVRVGQRVDHLGGEFKVVGLGARRRQRGHGDVLAADLFGQVLQRVEGGHDGQGAVLGGAAS